ncbi:hypothetical protein BDP81DRAFT_415133 [Colletotrichum phormii]|uniref:Uncharacterized protein n=1 Tax=Colletotrichum phormii TaxID=359342 RepID=A0AAJ0A0G5_9PEZI|nr:uncharacterized protein BDP81DRAFT_415133 [Colletotrichum phormii]KAK1654170.1 hypothetical protein BDP81DRAFT_415133 [Colletotrichum phormii]
MCIPLISTTSRSVFPLGLTLFQLLFHQSPGPVPTSELSRSSGPSICTGPVNCLHLRLQFSLSRPGRRLRSLPSASIRTTRN